MSRVILGFGARGILGLYLGMGYSRAMSRVFWGLELGVF